MPLDELSQALGIEIDPELLTLALTHSSHAYENGSKDNERLEYLGDSVLGFLVATFVYQTHSDLQEGELTKLKNAVVSANALATAANRMNLGAYIFLGKGEEQTDGRQKTNILADTFEAVLGAAYLSNGLEGASKIVQKFILPLLDDPDAVREASDPKTSLIEKLQRLSREPASYEITATGPEHERVYRAECFSSGKLLAVGEGRTKRNAETEAAIQALRLLQES